MEGKKEIKVSLGTVICIFIIIMLVLAIIGIVYYYKVMPINNLENKEIYTPNASINNTEVNSIKNNEQTNNTATITVEDAVNYVDGYYRLFKVKLPKVVGNTDTIEKLNLKILNEVLPFTYADVVCHAETDKTAMDKGSIYDYKYSIDNNILVIYVFSTVPEGGSVIPATGGGLNYFSYHYDIINDKILSVGETAEILKLELEGLKTSDGNKIESYKELDENYYIINIYEKNNIKLISKRELAGL